MNSFEENQIKTESKSKIDNLGRARATGRRKTSVARVWLSLGSGKFVVNGVDVETYFRYMRHSLSAKRPFNVTTTLGKFDVLSTVKGGGLSGQAGALKLGIARALEIFDPNVRVQLKSEKLLTRDSREVERKKYGKKKARKSFQFSKR